MSERNLAQAVLAWLDIPMDQQGGGFAELEALARNSLSTAPADDVREALAKAWDEGVSTAGAYGHEDTWTHDMTPYTENPYRGEVRPHGTVTDAEALAAAWDEGFSLATRNSPNRPHPMAEMNPYRSGEQGGTVTEPTAEQVLAGLNAEGPASAAAPSLDFYAAGNIARMRNVLRAAREVHP